MDKGVAARAALKAGVLGFFIGVIPLLGMVLTGALAIAFFRRKSKGFVLSAALGARLGGAAGVVTFAINAFFIIRILVSHTEQQSIDSLVQIAHRFGATAADSEIQASMHTLFTAPGLTINFVVTVMLASIGGALAAMFLRDRNPRQ